MSLSQKSSILTFLLLFLGALGSQSAHAQQQFKSTNLQFHYNFGKEIYDNDPVFLAPSLSFEHYSTDKYGETLVHVDGDIGSQGIADSRWILGRDLKFWAAPIALHGEYRGGLTRISDRERVNNVYVAGLDYVYADSSKALKLNFVAGYRYEQTLAKPHGLQLSAYWQWTSWNRLWTLVGCLETYTTESRDQETVVAFRSEPQVWLNLNQFVGVDDAMNLSLGMEGRFYYNVFMPKRFLAMPTLDLKWTF